MAPRARIGILLLNFGGPETPSDVRPFLRHLFADPEVVRLPAIIRVPLARLLAGIRYRQSREYYRQIGGGSPIRRITERQGEALKRALQQWGYDVGVYIGMQCWHPFIAEAVERIIEDGVTHLVVFPLFPQFSFTTTGACLAKLRREVQRRTDWPVKQQVTIEHWHAEPRYIEALSQMIEEVLSDFAAEAGSRVHLLFSAHSIPQRYVDEGDPYVEQTRETVERIMDRLGRQNPYHLAFQSRLGPVRWVSPYTDRVIQQLGREGVRHLLVIPISFVSEHIETLYEMDILYRETARRAGITDFRRVAAPNTHPAFIGALAHLIRERLAAFDVTSSLAHPGD
ncbi:MAG: ferrochelatase [Acidobacteria bacterium]|nr:MAG: ferrochelatase [Acidobacteriota bacterium]